MAAKLRRGDKVVVLAGKDKGREGTIQSVDPKKNKAIVDGINISVRHTKQTQNSQGGRVPTSMPIEISNLSAVDSNGKATRIGFRIEDGKKVRFAKTTGAVFDV